MINLRDFLLSVIIGVASFFLLLPLGIPVIPVLLIGGAIIYLFFNKRIGIILLSSGIIAWVLLVLGALTLIIALGK